MHFYIKKDLKSKNEYLIYYYWAFDLIIRRITSIITKLVGISSYVETINICIWVFVVVLCLDVFLNKIHFKDIIITAIVVIFFFVAPLIWPENDLVISNRINFLTTVFPYYFLGRVFFTNEHILYNMGRISKVVLCINIPIYVFVYRYRENTLVVTDNMAFAYLLLPHVLLLFYLAIKQKRMNSWFWALVGITILVMQGTRGPLLLLAIFYLWYCIRFNSVRKNVIYCLLIGCGIGLVFESKLYIFLINYIIEIFRRIGISTRFFELLLITNSIEALTGRNIIHSWIISAIKDNASFGLGPYGDILVTRNTGISKEGMYAHNLFLELMCHYGVIAGIVLCAILIIVCIKAYMIYNDSNYKFWLMVFALCSLVKFMFSGSYLVEPSMYVLLGFAISAFNTKIRKHSKNPFVKYY